MNKRETNQKRKEGKEMAEDIPSEEEIKAQ